MKNSPSPVAEAMSDISQSRLQKFLHKSPAEMFASFQWNLHNTMRHWACKARFGIIDWGPRGRKPAFLAYYPDGLRSFPDLSGLYDRWIRGNKTNNNGDASRFMALMLNLRQLKEEGIEGDFAELGVWKGNSAALLADYAAHSGKRLFLFDTFCGFDRRDIVGVDQGHRFEFDDTSIDFVRQTVGHPEITTYLPGFFPESVTDEVCHRTFALAHLDCDLYEPMKAALEFFYPRMTRGGMLILHDYSSGTWLGATRAIDEFYKATGEFISLWPDKSGTAIIRKSH